jgi:hypothetical protein
MCKYIYQDNRTYQSLQSGSSCIYPEFYKENNELFQKPKDLPIDEEGYCIFHSNNKLWKEKNNFMDMFFDLIITYSPKFNVIFIHYLNQSLKP